MRSPRLHPMWCWPAGALVIVTLLAVTTSTPPAAEPPIPAGWRWPCPADDASLSTATPDGGFGTPARLLAMADAITAVPADARNPAGFPFSAVHTQRWNVTGDTVAAWDRITWRAADGTARVQVRTLAPRRDPARLPDTTERERLAAAPAEILDYPLADGTRLGGVIAGPVPHDPQALANALYDQRGIHCQPHLLFDLYILLAGDYYLDQGARAATLRMLATIPGLTYDGIARDLTGRTGWAFVLTRTYQQTSDTILLDPATGALLTASTATITGQLLDHTLYLGRDRTSIRGHPPSP